MSITSGSRFSPGLAGRLGASLFFGVFLLMGLVFLALLGGEVVRTVGTYGWKETAATILSSSVVETKGDDPFAIEVRYRYQWEGKSYTSDRYHLSPKTYDDYQKTQRKISGLQAGTATVCYVNPRDPTIAILRRDTPWMAFFLLLPVVFIVVGGVGVYATWFGRKARARALSSTTAHGTKGTLVFGAVFVAVGAGLLVFWFVPALAKSLASARWTETPCTVISSRVKSHSDSDGTTYSVDIFYRYTVDGREYKSNRYGLFGGSSSGYRGKAAVVAGYPGGATRVCYVDPGNPNESVLKRGVGWEALFGLIPTAFLGAGIAVMLSAGRMARGLSGTKALPRPPTATADPSTPLTLKPAVSPLGKLIGAIFFTLFWNGIVSVFLWNLVGDFRHGSPNWFLAIFLVPFVLVGLGAFGGIGYFAMALTNPRCRVSVTPSAPGPGQTLEVAWTFSGSVQRLQRLRIFLEGREEATYRRGTSNHTDRRVFARIALTELTQGLEMAQGGARCRLPDGAPPSFSASNNKIVWTLKIHGEIPRWPDVNEEYEIVVTPEGGK